MAIQNTEIAPRATISNASFDMGRFCGVSPGPGGIAAWPGRAAVCVASGGFAPWHVGGRFDAERLAKVGRNKPVRADARQRHFRNQTVGPRKVEIVVVIVEIGPPDIIDETLRRNAVGDDALVFLKLQMPVVEPRRQAGKRQQADRSSVRRTVGRDRRSRSAARRAGSGRGRRPRCARGRGRRLSCAGW